ncbi:Protein W03G9.7, partial [Aphelenchoides avenae]
MGGCASSMLEKKDDLFNSLKKKDNAPETSRVITAKPKLKKDVERIQLTEGVVQDYINLEKSIHRYERKNVLKKYESKTIFADDVKKTVDQLEATYKELKKQTDKEKADVDNIEQPSVKSFLKQQGTWEQRFNKEQQEYLDALNKQEVAEKELKGAKMQYERAAKIAEIYKTQTDTLNDLYEKQDNMLIGIFGPDYASEKENKLEAELDDALEWQQRVSLAKFKWTNGRVLLVHASTQLAFGITRWKELEHIDP